MNEQNFTDYVFCRRELGKIFEPLVADIVRMIEHQVQEVRLKRSKKDISVS